MNITTILQWRSNGAQQKEIPCHSWEGNRAADNLAEQGEKLFARHARHGDKLPRVGESVAGVDLYLNSAQHDEGDQPKAVRGKGSQHPEYICKVSR